MDLSTRHFTFSDITSRINARKNTIPDYEALLMECKVVEDAKGILFNVKHKSWYRLIELVREWEEKNKRGSGGGSNSNSNSNSNNNSNNNNYNNNNNNNVIQKANIYLNKYSNTYIDQSNESRESILNKMNYKENKELSTTIKKEEVPVSSPTSSKDIDNQTNFQKLISLSKSILSSTPVVNTTTNDMESIASSCLTNKLASPTNEERKNLVISIINVSSPIPRDTSKSVSLLSFRRPSIEEKNENFANLFSWNRQILTYLKSSENRATVTLLLKDINRFGSIKTEERCNIWSYLLSNSRQVGIQMENYHMVTASDLSSYRCIVPTLISTELDLPNQRTLHVDIERTRPSLMANSEEMEYLLTMYCKQHNITYKQGMNYILAIFYLVPMNKSSRYECFSVFLDRYLLSFYNDEEFGVLQCAFKLLRISLLYMDPELCNYLDQYDMSPELYASPWFLTIFANKYLNYFLILIFRMPNDVIIRLMDLILSEDDPLFMFWLSLALLKANREIIFKHSNLTLPEALTSLLITNEETLNDLWASSRQLRASTPSTLITLMTRVIISNKISVDSDLYIEVHSLTCAPVSAYELVDHCFLTAESAPFRAQSLVKYFILDCRSHTEYDSGHLPCAYSIDSSLLQNQPEEFSRHLSNLSSLKGCHFCCFFDDAELTMPEQSLLLYFLSRGFRQISFCSGGYKQTHEIIRLSNQAGVDFIDHNSDACLECNPKLRRNSTNLGIQLFQSVTDVFGVTSSKAVKPVRPKVVDDTAMLTDLCSLPSTVEVKLLLTSLRNKNTVGSVYLSCLNRLLSKLFAHALESSTLFEKIVPVGSYGRDSHHSGVFVAQPIAFFIVLPYEAEKGDECLKLSLDLIRKLIEPFTGLLSVNLCIAKAAKQIQTSKFVVATTPKAADDESISPVSPFLEDLGDSPSYSIKSSNGSTLILPKSLIARQRPADVDSKMYYEFSEFKSILFIPSITSELEIVSIIRDLNLGGISDDSILILTLVCGKAPLRILRETFPRLKIYSAVLDEIVQSRLSPGFGNYVRK